MNIRASAIIYYENFGIRGLLAISANRVCGFPKYLAAPTVGIQHPVLVRLRTSDVELYKSVLLESEYDYAVPFSPCAIVDAGANCGMTSIFYANKYPEARIVAVEPEPSNYAALVRNSARYPNIMPVYGALWNVDGEVEVFPGGRLKRKWSFRVRTGAGCRAITLPTLMRETGIDEIDILKIDVEGAEREIFSTCNWMEKVKLLAIELHDRYFPGCSDAVNAVTTLYRKSQRGPVTFYCRPVSR
jgi:FkbM family methyltransferase